MLGSVARCLANDVVLITLKDPQPSAQELSKSPEMALHIRWRIDYPLYRYPPIPIIERVSPWLLGYVDLPPCLPVLQLRP